MSDERGQIALDFAIGASLFLLALVFAAIFIPTLISPFIAGGGQANDIAAERIASNLAWQLQEDSEHVSALNEDCTNQFFSGSGDITDSCYTTKNVADPSWDEIITEGPNTRVNVTLRSPDGSIYDGNAVGPDASVSGSGYASRPVRLQTGSSTFERLTLVVEVY
ncbi:DUF7287 family protein [Halococcoides cellulosivorans]|uniref:Uncharacterized protein n=1 Tax=Halococcoides cellulosivorans TaxID=1679096 RepID=A0A2R4WXH4_9EURY|nr:hypothetical protein [Halococcoides cellulosivorans]AWB26243.1 hypothetical protein HARCEL1_00160 [Halococcoides cellulosivorans]